MLSFLPLFLVIVPFQPPTCVPHPNAAGEQWCTLKLNAPAPDTVRIRVTMYSGKIYDLPIFQGSGSVGWSVAGTDRIGKAYQIGDTQK